MEFIDAGDHVVIGVRSPRLDATIGDGPLGGQIYNVFTVHDGKIV